MFEVIETQGSVPIHSWLPQEEIDPGTMEQILAAASHPEASNFMAVMPDAHHGYGVPIGTILVTSGSIIPNAVGVDIGCGVCGFLVRPRDPEEDRSADFWHEWEQLVKKAVPVGLQKKEKPEMGIGLIERQKLAADSLHEVVETRGRTQLGTLGGGNHFMEASLDEYGRLWFLVHSGSRNVGVRIADHYHKLAMESSLQRQLDVHPDLASLPIRSQEGSDYIHDMRWACNYARLSRKRMVEAMFGVYLHLTGEEALRTEIQVGRLIDTAHNYAVIHDEIAIHRKGASPATLNTMAVIPGTMATPSYVVMGKGNNDSHNSSSHGAGRSMSRGDAKRSITLDEFQNSLKSTYSVADLGYVDEAPSAYKDIAQVIERQSDLVEIKQTLHPIITIKGGGKND